ncbi:MAG: hypothetical protein GY926_19150 [bacterium]|nr:hypothetical protein [bacterium]
MYEVVLSAGSDLSYRVVLAGGALFVSQNEGARARVQKLLEDPPIKAPGDDGLTMVAVAGSANVRVSVDGEHAVRIEVGEQTARPDRIVISARDHTDTTSAAARFLVNALKKAIALRGCATCLVSSGRSPRALYAHLAEVYRDAIPWGRVTAIALDALDGHDAFASQLNTEFVRPLGVGGILLPSNLEAVRALEARLQTEPADLAVHGIGSNGHLAFCEPGSSFTAPGGRVALAEPTRIALSEWVSGTPPQFGWTLGLQAIRSARATMVLAFGSQKRSALHKVLEGPVNVDRPASSLLQQPRLLIVSDFAASGVNI